MASSGFQVVSTIFYKHLFFFHFRQEKDSKHESSFGRFERGVDEIWSTKVTVTEKESECETERMSGQKCVCASSEWALTTDKKSVCGWIVQNCAKKPILRWLQENGRETKTERECEIECERVRERVWGRVWERVREQNLRLSYCSPTSIHWNLGRCQISSVLKRSRDFVIQP